MLILLPQNSKGPHDFLPQNYKYPKSHWEAREQLVSYGIIYILLRNSSLVNVGKGILK